jgi:hypothetical protein
MTLNILEINMETFTLIGSMKFFDTKSKIHVSKEEGSASTSLCGRDFGFNWELFLINGKDTKHFTKFEIKNISIICKQCLKSIK